MGLRKEKAGDTAGFYVREAGWSVRTTPKSQPRWPKKQFVEIRMIEEVQVCLFGSVETGLCADDHRRDTIVEEPTAEAHSGFTLLNKSVS